MPVSFSPIKRLADAMFAPSKIDALADFLDNRFTLPGLGIRVGWDFFIGLIPVAGDVASALLSSYIVAAALYHKASIPVIGRMLANLLVDMVIGVIPVIGDLFDARWRANLRNARLLNTDLTRRGVSVGAVAA